MSKNGIAASFVLLWTFILAAFAMGQPVSLVPGVEVRRVATAPGLGNPIRIEKDPSTQILYYLRSNGDIYRLNVASGTNTSSNDLIYTAQNHGLNAPAGFEIGPDGTFYLVGNTANRNFNIATVVRGTLNAAGGNSNDHRNWSVVARTEPYPLSKTPWDHLFNAIIVSPDGQHLYLNSGSRTDHGEEQTAGGVFPGAREVGLTSCLLRIPATSNNLQIPNDREALRASGYLYAEGLRNTYDLRFAPNGDLFGPDNGPDRDMSDELNWLREGLHFGFPWRMSDQNNPQQSPDYNPSADPLLNPEFFAVQSGLYRNDPQFPPPPRTFTDPIENLGPDADSIRDPITGQIKDASASGLTASTFTSHRSPLGLVFDEETILKAEFKGDAFMLSWTKGDATGASIAGPFMDPGSDLVHLDLVKTNDAYVVKTRRLVSDFITPIDSEIIGNKIYVIEWGGTLGIYEVTLPADSTPSLSAPRWIPNKGFSFYLKNIAQAGLLLESSSNLVNWSFLTNIPRSSLPLEFIDTSSTNSIRRFYRVQPQ